jgi:hypothetical protein
MIYQIIFYKKAKTIYLRAFVNTLFFSKNLPSIFLLREKINAFIFALLQKYNSVKKKKVNVIFLLKKKTKNNVFTFGRKYIVFAFLRNIILFKGNKKSFISLILFLRIIIL